ncbi:hypothetical protein [Vibrio mytili]|nr:hypothetical protein [Vibrio mytili]
MSKATLLSAGNENIKPNEDVMMIKLDFYKLFDTKELFIYY